MPTATSSTDAPSVVPSRFDRLPGGRHVVDVGHLLRVRGGVGAGRGGRWLAPVLLVLTALVAVVPALAGQTYAEGRSLEVLIVLPTAYAAVLGLALVSAVASGGGRELLARDQATPYPISATTDHLGALLLAPLNIAWLLQAWVLLGGTAYAVGPARLAGAQLVVLLWLVTATAVAQVVAWLLEALRRERYGVWSVRALGLAAVLVVTWLQATDRLLGVLDTLPTDVLVRAGSPEEPGLTGLWIRTVATLVVVALLAVVAGAGAARLAARRAPREEVRAETGVHPARRAPRSDLAALLRIDRASVWRAVPMRRGLVVLAVLPGVIAVLGDLPWSTTIILPGLVASGGALLFGVNAWCLDGRGALWRESLPVAPALVFTVRAVVLAEALLVASGLTLLLAAVRAGLPSPAELAAVLSAWVVVTVQATGAAMTWSHRAPYAVDLRSARATPAPPPVMVVYSAKLALTTTLTGLVFTLLADLGGWAPPLLAAVAFLAWSGIRLVRARDAWGDPVERARVTTTVAA